MDKSHRLEFPIGSDEFEALGALTAHYSLTELTAAQLVWHLLKQEPYDGSIVTGPLSLKNRLELGIALAKNSHLDTSELEAVEKLFSKKDGITAKRNRFIHGVWSSDRDGRNAPISFSRAGKAIAHSTTTAETIESVTKEIIKASQRMVRAMQAIGFEPGKNISFDVPPPPLPSK